MWFHDKDHSFNLVIFQVILRYNRSISKQKTFHYKSPEFNNNKNYLYQNNINFYKNYKTFEMKCEYHF